MQSVAKRQTYPPVKRVLYDFPAKGDRDLKESLNIIANFIVRNSLDPVVIHYMKRITQGTTNWRNRIYKIHKDLKAVFVYRHDPQDRDFFKSAPLMLAELQSKGYIRGDCDDAVILAGSILKAAKFPLRIVALSNQKSPSAPIDHVALLIITPTLKPVYFDLTIDFVPDFKGRNIIESDVI